jgi:transcriptional regulator with XRE-family HTH domain
VRNKGALLLRRNGTTQREIADRLGCTQQAAQQWLSGATKPSKTRRGELRVAYSIPVESWDEEVEAEPAPVAPIAQPLPKRLPSSAIGKMEQIEASLMEQHAKVVRDPLATPAEVCKVGRECMTALDIIAKRRGEGGMDLAMFMRTPNWTRIYRAIKTALEPYPDAAARFAAELRRTEGEAER